MLRTLLAGVALVWWCSGCSRDAGLRCEDQERYSGSQEIAPIQVPDDLDTPDQSEALTIPTASESTTAEGVSTDVPCTESPPDFFEEGLPG